MATTGFRCRHGTQFCIVSYRRVYVTASWRHLLYQELQTIRLPRWRKNTWLSSRSAAYTVQSEGSQAKEEEVVLQAKTRLQGSKTQRQLLNPVRLRRRGTTTTLHGDAGSVETVATLLLLARTLRRVALVNLVHNS